MSRIDELCHQAGRDWRDSQRRPRRSLASTEDRAEPGCDRLCTSLVLARSGSTLSAQAAFVLDHVVAKLVRKPITQHESSQAVAGPRYDTVVTEFSTCRLQLCSLLRRQFKPQPPRRSRLIVENDSSRPHQHGEHDSCRTRGGRNQLHRLHAVVNFLAEGHQRPPNICSRRRVMSPGTGAARADSWKPRPARGTDCTRITPETSRHSANNEAKQAELYLSVCTRANGGLLFSPHERTRHALDEINTS